MIKETDMQTAAEFVQEHGLEALRGKPLKPGPDGGVVYVSDASLDEAIALWADELDTAYRCRMESKTRLYGAEVRNAKLVSWIYLGGVTLAEPEQDVKND